MITQNSTYLQSEISKKNTDFSLMHHGLMDCILSTLCFRAVGRTVKDELFLPHMLLTKESVARGICCFLGAKERISLQSNLAGWKIHLESVRMSVGCSGNEG